jgi:hypothetical protein
MHEFSCIVISMSIVRGAAETYSTPSNLSAFPKLDDVSKVLATVRQDDVVCRNIGQGFDSSGV